MADSPIRTVYGNNGRRPIRHVHFTQTKNPDGTFSVSGMGGKLTGSGNSLDEAMTVAQQAQQQLFATDQAEQGDGYRRITSLDRITAPASSLVNPDRERF